MSKKATDKKLTARQVKAIEALLQGQSTAQAARVVGVARSTVYDWLKQPAFASELQRLEALGLQTLGRQLMGLSTRATAALEAALDGSQPMNVRLRAAAIVCERGPALAELSALVARVEALERRLEDA